MSSLQWDAWDLWLLISASSFLSKEELKLPCGVKHVCYVGFYFLLLPFFLPPLRSGGVCVGGLPQKRQPQPPPPALLQNIPVSPTPFGAESQTSCSPQTMELDLS